MKDNQNSAKRSLIVSAIALALTAALLIGTTFAWFTSTASTGVNTITSGNLTVQIQGKDGNPIKNLNWVAIDNRAQDQILWEPGCTYTLTPFKIVNTGNLALKYKIVAEGLDGNDGLLKVIKFTYTTSEGSFDINTEGHLGAGDGTGMITVSAHMDENAGNEYENQTLTGVKLNVVATQDTVEKDSKDETYDANATYPEVVTASDIESFESSIKSLATTGAKKNLVVTIDNNLDNTPGIVTEASNSLTMDLNGNTVGVSTGKGSKNTTTNGMQLKKGSSVALKNGTYKATPGTDADRNIAILVQNYSNLTIENCTLDMTNAVDPSGNSKGTSYVLSSNCGKVLIKGNTNITARSGDYALDVMHWENASYKEDGTSVVFDETMIGTVDGKIAVYCYRNGSIVNPVDDGGATLTIKGGTFKNTGLTLDEFKKFVPTGYNVADNNGIYTVTKAS